MRARFHAEPDRPGDRAAAAGADAARRRGRPPARRGGATAGRTSASSSRRSSRRFTSPHGPMPAHAPALERPLRGDADRGGLGLQPLARPRRDPLARGRRRATAGGTYVFLRDVESGDGLVGRLPADAASSRTATRSTFSEDRAEIRRRDGAIATTLEVVVSPEDDAEVRRVTLTNLGDAGARDRADVATPRSCSRRPAADARPPGVLQAVRRRPSSSPSCDALARHAPAARRRTSRRSGRRTSSAVEGETVGGVAVRDRPGALPRPRPRRSARRCRSIDGRPAVEHGGRGARSDLQPAAPRAARRRARRARVTFSTLVAPSREAALDLADKYRDAGDLRARRHAGLDAGAGPAAPSRHRRPTRRTSSSGSPSRILYSDPALRAAAGRARRATRAGQSGALGARHLGRPADRAGADRRGRGSGDRPPAAARPRVLALKRLASTS